MSVFTCEIKDDVLNVLEQFVYKYELDRQRIVINRITKIDRTLGEII